MGTWDDHDYGIDNGDSTFAFRQEAAVMFVEFLEKSTRHEWKLVKERARAGLGVYGVNVLDFASQPEQEAQGAAAVGRRFLLTDEQAGIDPSVPARIEAKPRAHMSIGSKSMGQIGRIVQFCRLNLPY